jgi:peptidyl-prolyl cis-trans isomerase A (cyclophilin A)
MRTIRHALLVVIAFGLAVAAARPATAGTVATFSTNLGNFEVELSSDPLLQTTVENFLAYVDAGAYANSIIHRSTTYNYVVENGQIIPTSTWVLQGGSFFIDNGTPDRIPTGAPIPLQISGSISNVAGTLAMARTFDPNSATSGWFLNVTDNSAAYDGDYAVFGTVINGWNVIEQMAALTVYNATSQLGLEFGELPLIDFEGQQYVVLVNNITAVPEPSTWALAGIGLAAAALAGRRRLSSPRASARAR